MKAVLNIVIDPAKGNDHEHIIQVANELVPFTVGQFRVLKRSIDARQKNIKLNLTVLVATEAEVLPPMFEYRQFKARTLNKSVLVIGAGPAGLFAALRLLSLGIKPVIIERGKDVQSRRRDLAAIHKEHIVNANSNYCFGEGGAGTYSDGKLFTRSTKRGDVRSVLETLVQFGADENILSDAHPHIGTNKLPKIIQAIRQQIIEAGGEVHFNTTWTGVHIEKNEIKGIQTNKGFFEADAYLMATGHSARDVFSMLHNSQILIEFKPFALGVRVEHSQQLIDGIQYHCDVRPDYLPAASYSLLHKSAGRTAYSFCMCPGGIIAPCATAPDEVVTNGWSPSKRNNKWANSGLVVPVEWNDVKAYHAMGALAGMHFQKQIERNCHQMAGCTQAAPAQRLIDFVNNKTSKDLPQCSYQPGVVSVNLNEVLPPFISEALRNALKAFGKKMKGYFTNDALLVAPESRTSSPVRVPRNKLTLNHPHLVNFYPCGEGAGYAGGIISAAIDGEKAAVAIAAAFQEYKAR